MHEPTVALNVYSKAPTGTDEAGGDISEAMPRLADLIERHAS